MKVEKFYLWESSFQFLQLNLFNLFNQIIFIYSDSDMRSDSKLNGYRPGYNRNFDYQNSYISNRSGISAVNSEHLKKMVQQVQMYPSGFAELLKFQQRNIKSFKTQMSRQKQRVNDEMNCFKTQVIHILEDLRLSIHAYLDRIYQGYIERYAKFKGQILEINRLKDQIQIQCSNNLYTKSNVSNRSQATTLSSNAQTISQMENGNKQLKKYHFLNYIAELQKQRILPLNDLQREIVILNEYSNGFYQPKEFQQVLARLKGIMQQEIHRIYENSHLYIRQVDAILLKQQPKILDEVFQNKPPTGAFNNDPMREIYVERQNIIPQRQERSFYNTAPQNMTSSQTRIIPHNRTALQRVPNQNQHVNIGTPLYGQIGGTQQTLRVDWSQKISVNQASRFQVSSSQTALCGININHQISAYGLKDGTIQIVANDGQPIANLKEHKASICTLSLIKIKGQIYLASGSDIGCSKIVIWDIQNWQPLQIFENHKAAVTTIIDLQDNTHILSGSYDKKINIYNVEQGRVVYNLPANQTPVTGAIINKNATKVITCGLDKALTIWQISRNNSGKVQTLFLERKMQNDTLICSMVASTSQNDIVVIGTKDGKIKLVNIQKGQSYKTIVCSENYLIEMILIERDSKPYYPQILAWPHKENKILIVNSESGAVSSKTSNTFLQFGCGVSPKCFFLQRGGAVACVSHNEQSKEITIFRLQQIK